MNDTIGFYNVADSISDAISHDSIGHGLYENFSFVTEKHSPYAGPIDREVAFVSAGWNFMVLFMVMILLVMNKFFAPQRFSSIMMMPFQGGGEKMIRENNTFLNIVSISIIISFALLLSMLIQKIYLFLGGNDILHDNFNFFVNVVTAVAAVFVLNYLFTLFYSWLFKTESLLVFHVSLHASTMAMANLMLIPLMMVLLFYPYRFLFVVILIVLTILFFIRFIKLLIEVRMFSKLNFVNIFLYLCTVEILPVLIVFKMVLMAI